MIVIAVVSVLLILTVLLDAFEAIVLPRRVSRRFRLTRIFYRATWIPAAALARHISSSRRRETFLGFFGPLSLILLLSVWAIGLIVGFAMLHWSLGSPINATDGGEGFAAYLYLSGTTFFTLGYGDITPRAPVGRGLAIAEAGLGFAFLALIIGYLPVIYQAFSRRETSTSLLDARAGSPPTASELLRRHSQNIKELDRLLLEWERWSAELLETHLSYPVLCYYRSQHNNQSWLAALTAILDTSALVIVGVDGASRRQAQLTFAMARHAVVDIAQTFHTSPREPDPERLPPDELELLRSATRAVGVELIEGPAADRQLSELRRMYEPYVKPLADYLLITLPRWVPATEGFDNWQTSKWGRISGLNLPASCSSAKEEEEHF
ncbi:MAG TPA: potassium channel family protein [Blastocatellia bacterium]|nr:potassium channel family protein [Blastocatellia bacterium]